MLPGPVKHKRNGMLYCNIFIFLMALLTGLLTDNIFLPGLLIALSSFFFSMLSVYGNRAALIGTAALLVMILRMTDITDVPGTVSDSVLILAGGYMVYADCVIVLQAYTISGLRKGRWVNVCMKQQNICV